MKDTYEYQYYLVPITVDSGHNNMPAVALPKQGHCTTVNTVYLYKTRTTGTFYFLHPSFSACMYFRHR